MTAVYVLNSPVLTNYGSWTFDGPISVEQGKLLLRSGFVSAIGHEGAADFLSAVLGLPIPINRIRIDMQPGDCALVIRILDRMPEGKVLTREDMNRIPYELGILTRRADQTKVSIGAEAIE